MFTKATAEQQLFRLLQSIFQPGELRRFLRHRSDYAVLCNELPGEEASLNTVADAAIQALGRHGLITRRLFDALVEERPYRRDEIESVASIWDALAAQKEERGAREFHAQNPLGIESLAAVREGTIQGVHAAPLGPDLQRNVSLSALPAPLKTSSETGVWAVEELFELFDEDLQDAFSLAYNATRRNGSNRISTRRLFAAILRLRPELAALLPTGSLPTPLDESIEAKHPPLKAQPNLSSCVADSIAHLSMARPPDRRVGPLDMFVDVARHGTGPSVRQLRVHGIGRSEIDDLVRRRGWQVIRRKP